jgi:hypothetical protein
MAVHRPKPNKKSRLCIPRESGRSDESHLRSLVSGIPCLGLAVRSATLYNGVVRAKETGTLGPRKVRITMYIVVFIARLPTIAPFVGQPEIAYNANPVTRFIPIFRIDLSSLRHLFSVLYENR